MTDRRRSASIEAQLLKFYESWRPLVLFKPANGNGDEEQSGVCLVLFHHTLKICAVVNDHYDIRLCLIHDPRATQDLRRGLTEGFTVAEPLQVFPVDELDTVWHMVTKAGRWYLTPVNDGTHLAMSQRIVQSQANGA